MRTLNDCGLLTDSSVEFDSGSARLTVSRPKRGPKYMVVYRRREVDHDHASGDRVVRVHYETFFVFDNERVFVAQTTGINDHLTSTIPIPRIFVLSLFWRITITIAPQSTKRASKEEIAKIINDLREWQRVD